MQERDSNELIHVLFERQVERTPDAVAAIWGREGLTYTQLNLRANRIAHSLAMLDIRTEDRVGLYVERSLESVIGMLAILKVGAAYVPMDPNYPTERLQFMCRDSSVAAVLTTSALAGQLTRYQLPIVLLDGGLSASSHNPGVLDCSSSNLAYVIYTSGSTGSPKGVMVEHRSVIGLAVSAYAPIEPGDCVAHAASPSFDATTWEVWAPLINGARLLIVPQSAVLNAAQLNRVLVEHRVTTMFLTVGLFNEYVDELEEAFGRMRYLLTGGDALAPAIVARALRKPHPPKHLLNAYGPTETTTFATTFEISSLPEDAKSVPVGKPIENCQIYILNEKLEPVSSGTAGEVYIGGVGVARGYLNQEALTKERFVANPFSASAGRLYRSGDLGCWRDDGNLEFLGRNDFQVKIRGFRIELGEVEAAIRSCPGVWQAVAVAREEEPGVKRLVAYIIPDPHEETPGSLVQTVREYLKDRLPAYMVPGMTVLLDSLPLTPNGKVDRQALPAPDGRQQLTQQYVAARTVMEETLCGIWREALKVERVGVHDNFFELGGDSLLGIDTTDRIAEVLSVDLHFMSLFDYPTVGELAQFVSVLARDTTGAVLHDA